MDPKIIFIASEKMKSLIVWPLLGDSEWEYFGAGNETNKEKVKMIVDNYFTENDVYIVLDRHNAIECKKANIEIEIDSFLGNQNFIIWNKSLTLAIEFNKIGVLRRGKNRSLT